MSSVEIHAAEIAATSLHPETAIRLARALVAISAEFDAVVAEEIERLQRLRQALPQQAAGPQERAEFRQAVDLVRRDGLGLGHPLVSEVAASLLSILDSWRAEQLPLDVIDLHIETMQAVLADATLKPDSAAALVDDLAAAAADFIASAKAAA